MRLIKFLSVVVACAMATAVCATSAFAETSGSTKVRATVVSSYVLTVPESIILTSTKTGTGVYTGAIPVNVRGDIGEGQTVTVTSTAPAMKCTGSKDVTATFTGTPKKTWSREDTANNGTTENYALSASLTPGVWEGTAMFSCTLT